MGLRPWRCPSTRGDLASAQRGLRGQPEDLLHRALRDGADVIVMLHPDGQYDPAILDDMVEVDPPRRGDVVLGSRFLRPAVQGGRHAVVESALPTASSPGTENPRARLGLTRVSPRLSRVQPQVPHTPCPSCATPTISSSTRRSSRSTVVQVQVASPGADQVLRRRLVGELPGLADLRSQDVWTVKPLHPASHGLAHVATRADTARSPISRSARSARRPRPTARRDREDQHSTDHVRQTDGRKDEQGKHGGEWRLAEE